MKTLEKKSAELLLCALEMQMSGQTALTPEETELLPAYANLKIAFELERIRKMMESDRGR